MNLVSIKILMTISLVFFSFSAYSLDSKNNCVSCNRTVASGQPDISSVQKAATAVSQELIPDSEEKLSALEHFCHKFHDAPSRMFYGVIKDIEEANYSVDEFLQRPVCQLKRANANVLSPMLHVIAEDPAKRDKFLNILQEYYTKKRKNPSIYLDVLNAKNNMNETLLDYIETLTQKGYVYPSAIMPSLNKVIAFACSTGGQYSRYKDSKKCP